VRPSPPPPPRNNHLGIVITAASPLHRNGQEQHSCPPVITPRPGWTAWHRHQFFRWEDTPLHCTPVSPHALVFVLSCTAIAHYLPYSPSVRVLFCILHSKHRSQCLTTIRVAPSGDSLPPMSPPQFFSKHATTVSPHLLDDGDPASHTTSAFPDTFTGRYLPLSFLFFHPSFFWLLCIISPPGFYRYADFLDPLRTCVLIPPQLVSTSSSLCRPCELQDLFLMASFSSGDFLLWLFIHVRMFLVQTCSLLLSPLSVCFILALSHWHDPLLLVLSYSSQQLPNPPPLCLLIPVSAGATRKRKNRKKGARGERESLRSKNEGGEAQSLTPAGHPRER